MDLRVAGDSGDTKAASRIAYTDLPKVRARIETLESMLPATPAAPSAPPPSPPSAASPPAPGEVSSAPPSPPPSAPPIAEPAVADPPVAAAPAGSVAAAVARLSALKIRTVEEAGPGPTPPNGGAVTEPPHNGHARDFTLEQDRAIRGLVGSLKQVPGRATRRPTSRRPSPISCSPSTGVQRAAVGGRAGPAREVGEERRDGDATGDDGVDPRGPGAEAGTRASGGSGNGRAGRGPGGRVALTDTVYSHMIPVTHKDRDALAELAEMFGRSRRDKAPVVELALDWAIGRGGSPDPSFSPELPDPRPPVPGLPGDPRRPRQAEVLGRRSGGVSPRGAGGVQHAVHERPHDETEGLVVAGRSSERDRRVGPEEGLRGRQGPGR